MSRLDHASFQARFGEIDLPLDAPVGFVGDRPRAAQVVQRRALGRGRFAAQPGFDFMFGCVAFRIERSVGVRAKMSRAVFRLRR